MTSMRSVLAAFASVLLFTVGTAPIATAAEARALEPELHCVAAYLSPSTGVVDSHAFMLALQGDAESRGAMIAFKSPVTGGAVRSDGTFTSSFS